MDGMPIVVTPADATGGSANGVPGHLWPWTGWHAVVVDDVLQGVYYDPAAAVRAVLAVSGTPRSVTTFRIGGPSAVAVPPADAGVVPPPPPSAVKRRLPTATEVVRSVAVARAEADGLLARSAQVRRVTMAILDRSRAVLADSYRLLATVGDAKDQLRAARVARHP